MELNQAVELNGGDLVRVWPHGEPKSAFIGKVQVISRNQRQIAVSFADKPPFAIDRTGGMAIHPEHGLLMFARREELDGKPWGPWIEMMGGGHFEMEKV